MINQEAMNQLFRNENGHFENVTEESNSGDTGYGMGVAAGDYNNDGYVDLYITNVGKNTLLQNNGDGTFKDTTLTAGVGDIGWGASTAFADFDQDGFGDPSVTIEGCEIPHDYAENPNEFSNFPRGSGLSIPT